MRLKQELTTTAELVNGVLKRDKLKCPSLPNAKEDEELFYNRRRRSRNPYRSKCALS
jgi:hypothetical protein